MLCSVSAEYLLALRGIDDGKKGGAASAVCVCIVVVV